MTEKQKFSREYFRYIINKNLEISGSKQYHDRTKIYRAASNALLKVHTKYSIEKKQEIKNHSILENTIEEIESDYAKWFLGINLNAYNSQVKAYFMNRGKFVFFLLISLSFLSVTYFFGDFITSETNTPNSMIEVKKDDLYKYARLKGQRAFSLLEKSEEGIRYTRQKHSNDDIGQLVISLKGDIAQSIKMFNGAALIVLHTQKKTKPVVSIKLHVYGLGKPTNKVFKVANDKQNELFIVANIGDRKLKTNTVILEIEILNSNKNATKKSTIEIEKITFSRI
jgi:hypothetical protein